MNPIHLSALLVSSLALFSLMPGVVAQDAAAAKSPVILGLTLDGKKVLVQIDGEKVTATADGEDLPDSQVEKHKDGHIIIKDDEGNPVANIHRWAGGGQILSLPRSDKAAIGIELDTLSQGLADHLELDPNEVIYVTRAIEGRAAHKAGLKDNDVIVSINGESPVNEKRLREILEDKKPGDKLNVKVIRRGKDVELTIRCERQRTAGNTVYSFGGSSPLALINNLYDRGDYAKSLKLAMESLDRLQDSAIKDAVKGSYRQQLEKTKEALKKAMTQSKAKAHFYDPTVTDYSGFFPSSPKVFNFGKKDGKNTVLFDPNLKTYTIGEIANKAKAAGADDALENKIEKLEKRFDRLEEMLQKLLKKNN